MNLGTQIEKWRAYWRRATDPADVERQLSKLRWLEEFVFHCGTEITAEEFRALQQQLEAGEKKLAELRGEFAVAVPTPQAEQPGRVNR